MNETLGGNLKKENWVNQKAITIEHPNPLGKSLPKMTTAILLYGFTPWKESSELETEETNLRAEILASLVEIWLILEELEPERLKGYGELSEYNKALIKSHITSLLNKYNNLHQLLELGSSL